MVIVRYSCRADRFSASAAHKEKLQVKFVSHFNADVVLCCHLDFCRALSEESEFFYHLISIKGYHTLLTDAVK